MPLSGTHEFRFTVSEARRAFGMVDMPVAEAGAWILAFETRVYAQLLRRLGPRARPELAQQAVRDKVVENLSRFRGTTLDSDQDFVDVFTGWAKNRYVSLVTLKRNQSAALPPSMAAHALTPEELVERRQLADRLRRLIDKHPDGALLDLQFEGCSYDEIARRSDLSAGAVRNRLSRLRAELREQLKWD